jgi:hypothetical protein
MPGQVAVPVGAAALDLARAAAQLRLVALLLDRAGDASGSALGGQLAAAQDRFEQHVRRAEHQLTLQPNSAGVGPEGQTLPAWLGQLREDDRKLTVTPTFERLRAEAKSLTGPAPAMTQWVVSPLEQGRPLYWQGLTPQATPLVRFIPEEAIRTRQAWTLSTLLFVLLFAMWILWRSFRIAAWPEQLALLGCIGFILVGMTWGLFFLLLPGVWLAARVGQLVHWGKSFLGPKLRPQPVPLAQTGSAILKTN